MVEEIRDECRHVSILHTMQCLLLFLHRSPSRSRPRLLPVIHCPVVFFEIHFRTFLVQKYTLLEPL